MVFSFFIHSSLTLFALPSPIFVQVLLVSKNSGIRVCSAILHPCPQFLFSTKDARAHPPTISLQLSHTQHSKRLPMLLRHLLCTKENCCQCHIAIRVHFAHHPMLFILPTPTADSALKSAVRNAIIVALHDHGFCKSPKRVRPSVSQSLTWRACPLCS